MTYGGPSAGSWLFPMAMILLILYLGFVAVVTLAIMGMGRVNPRLAAWSASFGPRRLFALAGVFYVGTVLVFLALRVIKTSERWPYWLIAATFGAILAFVIRRTVRSIR